MATNERRKDRSGETQDHTTWFRITLWGRQAEAASQYLTKGRPVYIEGRLRVEEWTDRDNKQRYTLEVHATDMQFIGSRGEGGEAPSGGGGGRHERGDSPSEPHGSGGEITDDDTPFKHPPERGENKRKCRRADIASRFWPLGAGPRPPLLQ